MLQGVRIYTTDAVWRKVLQDLGAMIVDGASVADVDFDSLDIPSPVFPMKLKSIILASIDKAQRDIMEKVFHMPVALPRLQMRIVVLLHQTGGMFINDLKNVLGILPDVATHAIDTAIYQLRKTYGRDFIKNDNGKYSIGRR
ncbi:MAG: hypothetical protein LBJ73_02740 [Rickettsiales bacterium]|jgi:hypothetical protein|nr:hypothetical protein [Rickettsiales bacterium]